MKVFCLTYTEFLMVVPSQIQLKLKYSQSLRVIAQVTLSCVMSVSILSDGTCKYNTVSCQ